MSRRPILVTGSSGFAGGHLIEHLAGQGHDVVGWTRADVDLLDAERVRAGICDLRPSEIYHCAGASRVAGSWQDASHTLATNVLATHYLLDAVRQAGVTPMSKVETGAEAILQLAVSPKLEGRSGLYFNVMNEARANSQSYDANARRKLRALSLELTGLASRLRLA